MFELALASSQQSLPQAAQDVIAQIRNKTAQFNRNSATLSAGILFSSQPHNRQHYQQALNDIMAAFPTLQLVGCTASADGNSAVNNVQHDQLTLAVFITDQRVSIHAGVVENITAGQAQENVKKAFIATQQAMKKRPKLCLVFPAFFFDPDSDQDHLQCISAILNGVEAAKLPPSCKVFGGMAADYTTLQRPEQLAFSQSFQFYNNQVFTHAMPYLLFSGPIKYQYGYGDGVEPLQPEIAWQPAYFEQTDLVKIGQQQTATFLQSIKNYPKLSGSEWIYYPLIVRQGKTQLNRDLMRASNLHHTMDGGFEDKSVSVKVGFCSYRKVIESSQHALTRFAAPAFKPTALLGFSGITRAFRLNDDSGFVDKEYGMVKDQLVTLGYPQLPSLIMYCFGEIGYQHPNSKTASFNSMAFVTVLLGEERRKQAEEEETWSKPSENLKQFSLIGLGLFVQILQDEACIKYLRQKKFSQARAASLLHQRLTEKFAALGYNPPAYQTIYGYLSELNYLANDETFMAEYINKLNLKPCETVVKSMSLRTLT